MNMTTQRTRHRVSTLGVVQRTVGEGGKLVETYRGYEIVKDHEKAQVYRGKVLVRARDRFVVYGAAGIAEWALWSLAQARAWIDATLEGKTGGEKWAAVKAAK